MKCEMTVLFDSLENKYTIDIKYFKLEIPYSGNVSQAMISKAEKDLLKILRKPRKIC
jgi:hypothetical protein